MIYIITGKTGHGKSAYMAKMARDALKQGHRIFSNIKFNAYEMGVLPKVKKGEAPKPYEGDIQNASDRANPNIRILYWSNFSDWIHFENGIVFIDEGLVYFNARKWEQLPDNMQMKFVQHRKDKVDLVFNVQHYSFIEKTLRVLCERFINVELKIGSPKFKKSWIPRISRVVEVDLPTLNRCENLGVDPYNPSNDDEKKYGVKPIWTEWFWIWNNRIWNIFNWYDTSVKVVPSRPEPLMHFERNCPHCGKIELRHA